MIYREQARGRCPGHNNRNHRHRQRKQAAGRNPFRSLFFFRCAQPIVSPVPEATDGNALDTTTTNKILPAQTVPLRHRLRRRQAEFFYFFLKMAAHQKKKNLQPHRATPPGQRGPGSLLRTSPPRATHHSGFHTGVTHWRSSTCCLLVETFGHFSAIFNFFSTNDHNRKRQAA